MRVGHYIYCQGKCDQGLYQSFHIYFYLTFYFKVDHSVGMEPLDWIILLDLFELIILI